MNEKNTAQTKSKTKYNILQNVGWMIQIGATDDADKARVNDMFEAAKTKMRIASPTTPPVSLDDQVHELAEEPR